MKSAFEPFLIGMEVFVFCMAVSVLFLFITRYSDYEKAVNTEVNRKIDIGTSAEGVGEESRTYIRGASVISEIYGYDGSLWVKVNSIVLNDIQTPTGEPFFEYIRKYGNDSVMNLVSITGRYKKECLMDSQGNITGIWYTLI